MDMLFYEDEIEKVSKTIGPTGWHNRKLQDPRINGDLQRDLTARRTEARNLEERRKRLLKGYDR